MVASGCGDDSKTAKPNTEDSKASEGSYQDGVNAAMSGDFKQASAIWEPLAKQGDAKAQANLGVMHFVGQGFTQNFDEAIKWFRLSAEQGNAKAQFNLGAMYFSGQGTAQDYNEALKSFRLSADQGYSKAQVNLAEMYRQGQGGDQNFEEAVKLFQLVIAQGDDASGLAHANLGDMYRQGQGVSQDNILASMHFHIASDLGFRASDKTKKILTMKMAMSDVAESQRMADDWLAKHQKK